MILLKLYTLNIINLRAVLEIPYFWQFSHSFLPVTLLQQIDFRLHLPASSINFYFFILNWLSDLVCLSSYI